MSINYSGDDSGDLKMELIAQQLPDDHHILDAAYAALQQLNDACIAGDTERRETAANRFEACIWKLNGKTFFGASADDQQAANVISEYCSADAGTVPMWGQHGDFIIKSPSGIRARVKTEAGCMMGYLSASFHVVDLSAAFVSETGYRSYMFQFSDILPGETVELHVMRVFQNLLDARKKPVFVDADHRDSLAADPLPAWMNQITPLPDRTPETLPAGFVRVTALLPTSKAFIACKWSVAAKNCISDIIRQKRLEDLAVRERELAKLRVQSPKEYKQRLIEVQQYREFYVGARCEIAKVNHPVSARNIGTVVKIVTIYDSGTIVAHDDKPPRYSYNNRGRQIIEYDPRCIMTYYSADNLKLIEDKDDDKSG
ncbi:protein klcB [Serratia sp. S1B]|nr:protein klcB [Serratia sp. S1B]